MEWIVDQRSLSDRAEYLSRRRARSLPALVVIYLAQQATFFSALGNGPRRFVDDFKIAAWVVLSIMLLLGIATKGFWLERKEVRELIDEEGTRANRAQAMRAGFVFACLAALGAYALDKFQPISVGEAAQLVLSLGLGAALVRFGMLERRAHNDG